MRLSISNILGSINNIIISSINTLSSLQTSINNFLSPAILQDVTAEQAVQAANKKPPEITENQQNIFNQQYNLNYLLQDMDIQQILQYSDVKILPILIQDIGQLNQTKDLQPLNTSNTFTNNKNYDSTSEVIITNIKSLYSSSELETVTVKDNSPPKSQHFIVNINRNHWTCLSLVKNGDILYVLYKDSSAIESTTMQRLPLYIKNLANLNCKIEQNKIKFIANATQEQQDAISCGIFALKNLEIIQQELSKENVNHFLENFVNFSDFCKQNDIRSLYKKYAQEYMHSQIKSILLKENNKTPITKDTIKQELKENLHVLDGNDLANEINTYVDSYNPNASLEAAFSKPYYSSIWLLNKCYLHNYSNAQHHPEPLQLAGLEEAE